MKYIFLILFSCGFYSCGDSPTVTYKLHNETIYQVKISGFSNRTDINNKPFYKEAEVIFIEPFLSYEVTWDTGEGLNTRTYFSIPEIDSVRVVFNDEKLLVLKCDLSDTRSCHAIFQPFEASITQEDYESAIPIEEE
ncbi:hypothetical protein [Labilibaculum euxinus]|uniref:Uncharacterized protein n=1 Tax=Labilibaculum euxinus TaxID=2686357 RepID=A0A7M4D5A9_9BACT|nr:hypothetical protein [Labilibaculum euxinus]MUP37838.1 hypothetical protein [Labilibaculum euxinus]MVB07043.1 hypothetical protein [Labilibaculum euxinus]